MAFGKHARKIQQKCMRPVNAEVMQTPLGGHWVCVGTVGSFHPETPSAPRLGVTQTSAQRTPVCVRGIGKYFRNTLAQRLQKVFPNDVMFKIP